MSQFSPKRVVKLEVKSKYSPEKLNDAIKANNYKRNRNLINYFMEEGENITILEDKDWAKDLINLVEEEEKLQKIKMEQEDEEFARKLLDEEKSTELARRLHEEEESKRQEHLKKLTEIEQQDYEYVKKLQAEETKEYEKARKLEEEDKKIAERLQKIEMKEIEKEIEEYEKAWNNPKIVHGEDEEGIYILVSLPYVKKYGVLLDHTHNKIYLRAEGNDLTNGKRQYIIDTKNLLFSFDIPFMPGEKVPNERDVSGTYDESNELLKIRVKGAKMNDENRSTFMNRFKATFKRIFNS